MARREMEYNYTQLLLRSRLEVQEYTLASISKELHDNINQVLTASVLQLNVAMRPNRSQKETIDIVTATRDTIKGAISDIRSLSHNLSTGLVEKRDLSESLKAELDRIDSYTDLKCSLELEGDEKLSPEQRLLLFRVVQEALQNILKHSRATEVNVQLTTHTGACNMLIKDNGVGFDLEAVDTHNSLGFQNMRERIALLNGTLQVESSEKGTSLHIQVPLNPVYA
jgi:signal transduction histidine kinase